jgi:hypothetical protein
MNNASLDSLLRGQIAIVCHDAGSANIIISWLKKMPDVSVKAHLEGPAAALWAKAFPESPTFSFADVFYDCSMLISGTGWASDLEHNARVRASSEGMRSIAVIDHWVNYKERFIRKEYVQLPDHICVTDKYAYNLVQKIFPEVQVSLMPNSYLDEQVKAINLLTNSTSAFTNAENILYVLEPIRVPWDGGASLPGEFQALDYFVSSTEKITSANSNIKIRPHPSDSEGKYKAWVERQIIQIDISEGCTLFEDIAWSSIVVGCQSYAMVVALAAKKRVICSLPPFAPELALPYAEIEQIRSLRR